MPAGQTVAHVSLAVHATRGTVSGTEVSPCSCATPACTGRARHWVPSLRVALCLAPTCRAKHFSHQRAANTASHTTFRAEIPPSAAPARAGRALSSCASPTCARQTPATQAPFWFPWSPPHPSSSTMSQQGNAHNPNTSGLSVRLDLANITAGFRPVLVTRSPKAQSVAGSRP